MPRRDPFAPSCDGADDMRILTPYFKVSDATCAQGRGRPRTRWAMMFLFTWVVPPAMVCDRTPTRSVPQDPLRRVRPEHGRRHLGDVLLGLAPHELRDARLGPEGPAVQLTGDRAVRHELQQLGLEVDAREVLPEHGVARSSPVAASASRARLRTAAATLRRVPRCSFATPPRSCDSVVIATRHPSCTGPSSRRRPAHARRRRTPR